jgi:hypothetical protein
MGRLDLKNSAASCDPGSGSSSSTLAAAEAHPFLSRESNVKPGNADDDIPPPSYTDATTTTSIDPTSYLGDEPPPFAKYSPTKHYIRNRKVVSHDVHLNTDVEALYQWLHEESSSIPNPLMTLEGIHSVRRTERDSKGETKTTTNTVTDFQLTFDLSSFLKRECVVIAAPAIEKRRRGTRNSHVASPVELEDAMSIRDWCAAYIKSPAMLKEFVLRKRVEGLQQDFLCNRLESIARSTQYCGEVRVRVVVENRSVVLAPDNWVCRIRYSWYRWLFYISFLWVVTWPILWLLTKRWDVVDAVFNVEPDAEQQWVTEWGHVIRSMVRQKRVQSAITPGHLRWAVCHEFDESQRLRCHDRSDSMVGAFLTEFNDGSEYVGRGWGADEEW